MFANGSACHAADACVSAFRGKATVVTESIRFRMTRKNLVIDGGLARAIEGLYELYYLYLVEHPELADYVEDLMYQINDCRSDLRHFHQKCWDTDPPQFRDIDELGGLLIQARKDVSVGGEHCRGYLKGLAALARESSIE